MTHLPVQESNIRIEFEHKDVRQELKIQEQGFLFRPSVPGTFVVFVKPLAGYPFFILRAENNHALFYRQAEPDGFYRLSFPTTVAQRSNVICTKFALKNDFRIVRVLPGNVFQMCQLAIVSQGGNFFFRIIKQYEGGLLQNKDGKVFVLDCPRLDYDNWPQLQPVLTKLSTGLKLEEFNGHQKKVNLDKKIVFYGKVRWYNPSLHYGIVAVLKSVTGSPIEYIFDARVYEGELGDLKRDFATLYEGEVIKIETLTTRIVNTRGFASKVSLEAKGISLIRNVNTPSAIIF
ncbi:MAG: hypothetical protein HYW77_03460 [Parcubacteria group bacterium]|nr:hypothetical protein [Parcubacteria group bacterium]